MRGMALHVIDQSEIHGKLIKVYGSHNHPLFLAKDVAELIENDDVTCVLNAVDEGQKRFSPAFSEDKGLSKQWFLTEDGFFEVIMQSRSPLAIRYKKNVRKTIDELWNYGAIVVAFEEETEDEIIEKALFGAQRALDEIQGRDQL